MEAVKRAVKQIAYTPPSQWHSNLSAFPLSLTPFLFLTSSLYSVAVRLRHHLYRFNILHKHRLPVPVISVGNLTWGGNGKTPMVEFLARSFADDRISPLILTRGYGGADEAKMLQRQLKGTSAKIGIGANRVATATTFIERYGYVRFHGISDKIFAEEKTETQYNSDKIGVAVLDDGMQHLSVWRDLEIVMVNALMPWGNNQLIPLGALREPLTALGRADIVVIHHADLVSEKDIDDLESTIREVDKSIPIFFTKMAPIRFFPCRDVSCKLSLRAVENMTVLCLSGIGSADSFIQRIERMSPAHVDHLDFSDHHLFQPKAHGLRLAINRRNFGPVWPDTRSNLMFYKEIEMVQKRLEALESEFAAKPIVIVTEKDYDRAPEVLEHLKHYEVLVLCCRLQFLAYKESTEERFKKIVRDCLSQRLGVN